MKRKAKTPLILIKGTKEHCNWIVLNRTFAFDKVFEKEGDENGNQKSKD